MMLTQCDVISKVFEKEENLREKREGMKNLIKSKGRKKEEEIKKRKERRTKKRQVLIFLLTLDKDF